MAVSSIAAFWAVAALLIVVPGADWAFVIGAAVQHRSVVPAVGGLVLGYSGITAIVAAGVGAAVAGSPGVLTGLTVVGGLYLAWHGAMTLTHPASPVDGSQMPDASSQTSATSSQTPDTGSSAPAGTGRDVLLKGIGVSGLNPKGLLIFLALLPQFTHTEQRLPVSGQIGVLGLVFTVTCAVFYLTLGKFAQTVLHARPSAARAVSRVAGASMIVIGLLLIIERLAA
jgi:threonine/homoserine/homoserine lactone efflux protein